jgi:hypothetical protein
MTLLHAVGDAVVGRRDVTLGHHPTESQVRRAAAQCFGIGLDEAVHTPNQSIHHLIYFVCMPCACDRCHYWLSQ